MLSMYLQSAGNILGCRFVGSLIVVGDDDGAWAVVHKLTLSYRLHLLTNVWRNYNILINLTRFEGRHCVVVGYYTNYQVFEKVRFSSHLLFGKINKNGSNYPCLAVIGPSSQYGISHNRSNFITHLTHVVLVDW